MFSNSTRKQAIEATTCWKSSDLQKLVRFRVQRQKPEPSLMILTYVLAKQWHAVIKAKEEHRLDTSRTAEWLSLLEGYNAGVGE